MLVSVVGFELLRRKEGAPSPPPAPIEAVLQLPVEPNPADDATRTTVGKIAAILEAIEQYQKAKNGLPSALTSLNRAYANPEESQDGWGQSILYLVNLTNKGFVIRSAGPDGKRETPDDISVGSDGREAWLNEKEPLIRAWRLANAGALAQQVAVGASSADPKKLEATRKREEEKKKQEAEVASAADKHEQEQKRLDSARLEEEKRRQAVTKREDELRQAKAREEVFRQ